VPEDKVQHRRHRDDQATSSSEDLTTEEIASYPACLQCDDQGSVHDEDSTVGEDCDSSVEHNSDHPTRQQQTCEQSDITTFLENDEDGSKQRAREGQVQTERDDDAEPDSIRDGKSKTTPECSEQGMTTASIATDSRIVPLTTKAHNPKKSMVP
jgi:hypothetical protein